MRVFGWFVAILMIMGMMKIIDVQICIAGKGNCPVTKETKNESTDLRNIPTSRQPSAR